LVPGERGHTITIRMLINHTSGLADYLRYAYPSLEAFPSLKDTTPQSLDDHRFTRFQPTDLIELGVRAPAFGKPGGTPGIYSNTNYQILGQLLERVTGMTAEKYITQNVIERAGLCDTELPTGPHISRPHSEMYEAWFGMIEPPRDYSVFDMSWWVRRPRSYRPLRISIAFTACCLQARSSMRRRWRRCSVLSPSSPLRGRRSSTASDCTRWRSLAMARFGAMTARSGAPEQ